jgi:hypothetical protein
MLVLLPDLVARMTMEDVSALSRWSLSLSSALTLSPLSAATEPKFKFKFTEPMRFAILNAVELDDEMSTLITEKQYGVYLVRPAARFRSLTSLSLAPGNSRRLSRKERRLTRL